MEFPYIKRKKFFLKKNSNMLKKKNYFKFHVNKTKMKFFFAIILNFIFNINHIKTRKYFKKWIFILIFDVFQIKFK